MTALQRIVREPNALVGVVTSGLGLAVLFGVDLSRDQIGGIILFLGAVVILLRQVVVPASEAIAVRRAGKTQITAGPAADIVTGTVVDVTVAPRPPVGTPAAPPDPEA